MCYSTSTARTQKEMERLSGATMQEPATYKIGYHNFGFDHPIHQCIPQGNDHIMLPMLWGFVERPAEYHLYEDHRLQEVVDVPNYWRRVGGYALNSQAENVFDYYKTAEAIRYRRCIIPVSGFFESKEVNGNKYPHLIYPKRDELFYFAGIYNINGDETYTFKILTRPASDFMAEIHNKADPDDRREPCILDPEYFYDYLDHGSTDQMVREALMTEYSQGLQAHPVMKSVNNARIPTDVPEAIEPFDYPELNDLFNQ